VERGGRERKWKKEGKKFHIPIPFEDNYFGIKYAFVQFTLFYNCINA
jgi:hypothetical protein